MSKRVRISGIVIEYLEEDEVSVENAQEILDLLSSKMVTTYGSGQATIMSRLTSDDIEEL